MNICKLLGGVLILGLVYVSLVFAGTWKDNFEDGSLADWEEEGFATNWKESEGVLVNELERGDRSFLLTGEQNWNDYTVAVKLRVVNLAGGDWCGILLRYKNTDSHYWFGISTAWTKYAAGTANETREQELIPVKFTEWYKLRAEVNKDNLKLFVNDKLFFETDIDLNSGRVGLFTQNSMTEFDDFSVTGPEITDGGPGFSVEPKYKLATTWGNIKF